MLQPIGGHVRAATTGGANSGGNSASGRAVARTNSSQQPSCRADMDAQKGCLHFQELRRAFEELRMQLDAAPPEVGHSRRRRYDNGPGGVSPPSYSGGPPPFRLSYDGYDSGNGLVA